MTTHDATAVPEHPPTPGELRDEFERIVAADLHGPRGGDLEEVTGGRSERLRDRYLVGVLAPAGTIAVDPERAEDPGVDGDVAADDGTAGAGGSAGEGMAAKPALFPSSIGMSFVVAPDVPTISVTSSWGRYDRVEVGDADSEAANGGAQAEVTPGLGGELPGMGTGHDAPVRPKRVWRRAPMRHTVDVPLTEGLLEPRPAHTEAPEVTIEGRATKVNDYWVVSLFLVNGQEKRRRNGDANWLYQVSFAVTVPTAEHPDGAPVFVGRSSAVPGGFAVGHDPENELALLDMAYRDQVEFAAGHNTAVHATLAGEGTPGVDPTRAVRLETRAIPAFEVPRTEAPTLAEQPGMAGAILDMRRLAETAQADLPEVLTPLVDAYEAWLTEQEQRIGDPSARLAGHDTAVAIAVAGARDAAVRLRAGIELLARDADAAEAFRFANEAMWQQRIHMVAAESRLGAVTADAEYDLAAAIAAVDVEKNRSWRPFQAAFMLLNLPALTDPTHPERVGDSALLDLLFFPTGGGKTEAYLGLTAYTLAIRRLQGTVAGHDGDGVAVLMRYTLRLLTAQQFARASALICACEVLRRRNVTGDSRWGDTPFRVGLWVGGSLTPNRGKEAQAVIEDTRAGKRARGAQPVQLTSCPWCGRALDPGADADYDPDRWRTFLRCGDPLGTCDFTGAKSGGEGLPVITVDDELYRLLPSMVIATADKFAQLPLKGPLHLLFGRVSRRCERHGYRSPELDSAGGRDEADRHRKRGALPEATTVEVNPLRPPDLIIQDELHLISGPLGTLVGLYETAIDRLCSWDVEGTRVRPKVVASTATIRRARRQVHALFWRNLAVFPPPVLDADDSFFARQRPTGPDSPGRRYLGICAVGQRVPSIETRVFTTVLAAAQQLYERHGRAADPWMTMVAYFSALRELGGARRLVDDDVRSRLRNADRRGLSKRSLRIVRELTSRVTSGDITEILAHLGVVHDPASDGVPGVDVLLATNMISVGVDVPRLGLMVTVGQPKTTAEYIQATSRVGRDPRGPGLVLTIYNWARPRDLSHFETFEHYHATFYRHGAALSVTPFSPRAIDRGLTAVLVSLLRQAYDSEPGWNPNTGAHVVETGGHPVVTDAIETLAARAEAVAGRAEVGELIRDAIADRLDEWGKRRAQVGTGGGTLGYAEAATVVPLLEPPGLGNWPKWAVPNSLRETEPTVNLILDPKDWSLTGGHTPTWDLGAPKDPGAFPAAPPTAEDADDDEEPATVEEVLA